MNLEEIVSWVLKGAIIPLFLYIISLRDKILEGERIQKENIEKIKDLEIKRAADLQEYNSTLAMAKGLESMMETKLIRYFAQAAEERHKEMQALRETFGGLNDTLITVSNEMKYFRRDLDDVMKNKGK